MHLNPEEAAHLRAYMHNYCGPERPQLLKRLLETLRARGCLAADYLLLFDARLRATDPTEAARLQAQETETRAALDAVLAQRLRNRYLFFPDLPLMSVGLPARNFVGATFRRDGPNLLRHAGLIQLQLKPSPGVRISQVADNPLLSHVVDLTLTGWGLTDRDLETLLRSPYLENVYKLNLGENEITAKGVRALLASPLVERLTYLQLYRNEIKEPGIRAIAASSFLRHLQYLSLGENRTYDFTPIALRFPHVPPYYPAGSQLRELHTPVIANNSAWYWREVESAPGGEFHFQLLHRRIWHMTCSNEPTPCFIFPYQQLGQEFTEVREATFAYRGSAADARRVLNDRGVVAFKGLYVKGVLDATFTVGGTAHPVRLVCDTPAIRTAVSSWLAGVLPDFADWEDLRNHLARLNPEWYVELFRYRDRLYASLIEGMTYLDLPRLPKELAGHLEVMG